MLETGSQSGFSCRWERKSKKMWIKMLKRFIALVLMTLGVLIIAKSLKIWAVAADATEDPKSAESIRAIIKSHLQRYKLEVEKVHGLNMRDDYAELDDDSDHELSGRLSRQKRTMIKPYDNLPGRRRRNITEFDFDGTNVVKRVFQLSPQPFDKKILYDLNIVHIKSELYAFTLEKDKTSEATEIVVYKFQDLSHVKEITRKSTPGAKSIEIVHVDWEYYIFLFKPIEASPEKLDDGSKLYHFDLEKSALHKIQTIVTPHAQASHFWAGSGQEANDVYCAVAPAFTKSETGVIQYRVEIPIYRWQGAHYDYIYSITGYNPQAIRYTTISTHEFLAVANYQDSPKSTTIFSDIYKYNHKESKFIKFQSILTKGAKDVQFFSFENGQHGEHFLTIANQVEYNSFGAPNFHVKSQILKFASDRFIPFQSFATNGAFQILPVKSGKVFLLVIGEAGFFRIVQYNGFRFVETFRAPCGSSQAHDHALIRVRPLVFEHQPYFAVAGEGIASPENGLFALEFEPKNQFDAMRKDFQKWCSEAVNKIKATDMPLLRQRFDEAPKLSDGEIVLKGELTFDHVKSNSFFTKSLAHGEQIFDASLSRAWAEKGKKFVDLISVLRELEIRLSGVLLKNAKQTVSSPIEFLSVEHHDSTIRTSELTAEFLNKIDIKELLSKLIHLDKDYTFTNVKLDKCLAADISFERLNGHALAEYALKSAQQEQMFALDNTFSTEVHIEKGFKIDGNFDGIDFHNIDFLLNKGNQTFTGNLHIHNSQVANLISEIVNDVNLAWYMKEGVTKTGSAVISGSKEFDFTDIKELHVGHIESLDIFELYAEAIYLKSHRPQHLRGDAVSFEKLTSKDVKISTSLLNEKYHIGDLVNIVHGKYHFDTLELTEDAIIHDLTVTNSLNSVEVIDGKLNIIRKNSPNLQVVSLNSVKEITLEENALTHGLVGTVNLTSWAPEKHIELKSNRISFSSLNINGDLSVKPGIQFDTTRSGRFLVGSHDVNKLLSKALPLDATKLPPFFHGTINFETLVVDDDTEVRLINNVSPKDWLLAKHGKEGQTVQITGQKSFTGDLELRSPATTKELYSTTDRSKRVNILNGLNDLLLDHADQTLLRNTKFTGLLTVENLHCSRADLDGVMFEDLLLKKGEQHIAGKVVFKEPIIVRDALKVKENLEIDKIWINGEHLSVNELIKDTLLVNSKTPQIVTGRYEFRNSLDADIITIEDGLIGEFNLTLLLMNIIRDDTVGESTVEGSIRFNKETSLERLEFQGKMNGISHSDWGDGFLLTAGHQIIQTPARFANGLACKEVRVLNDKVSNLDFVRLAHDVLRIDDNGALGVVMFAESVEVSNKGILLGKEALVNGYYIHKDLLLHGQTATQVVTGTKTFTHPVKVHGNLNIGTLNGFEYNQAVKFVENTIGPHDNLLIQGDLTLENEIDFGTHFKEHDWEELIKNIWWLNKPATISSKDVHFHDIIFENGAKLHGGKVDGVDLELLERDYLSKTKDQVISAEEVVFVSGVHIEHVKVPIIELLNQGRFNNLNLTDFMESVLLNDVDQKITWPLNFNEVRVSKIELAEKVRVGGIDLDVEAVTVHGKNMITGKKIVQNLNAEELHLDSKTKLNGVDILEWNSKAVKSTGEVSISGDVKIHSAVFTQDVIARSTVDGIQFNHQNILTLTGDQLIEEQIVLKEKDLHLGEITVTGKFNGFNLAEFIEPLVQTNYKTETGPLFIHGVKTFTQMVFSDSLVAEDLWQGKNITETMTGLKPEAFIRTEIPTVPLTTQYEELIDKAELLIKLSNKRAVFLDYFERTNVIKKENLVKLTTLRLPDSKSATIGLVSATESTAGTTGASKHILSFLSFNEATNLYESSLQKLDSIELDGSFGKIVEMQGLTSYWVVLPASPAKDKAVSLRIGNEEPKFDAELANSPDKLAKTYVFQVEKQAVGGYTLNPYIVIHGYRFGQSISFVLKTSPKDISCFLVIDLGTPDSTDTDTQQGPVGSVYCMNELDSFVHEAATEAKPELKLFQNLPTTNPSLVTAIVQEKYTLLMIGSKGDGKEHGGIVDVWSHEADASQFKKIDCLPIISLVCISSIVGPNNNSFLALASAQVNEHPGGVYIYKFLETTKKFAKVLSIPVEQPLRTQFQLFDSEAFLYILSSAPLHNVQVYSFKGKMGWQFEHRFTSSNGKFLAQTRYFIGNNLNSELLVGKPDGVEVFTAVFHGTRRKVKALTENTRQMVKRSSLLNETLTSSFLDHPIMKETSELRSLLLDKFVIPSILG